MDTWACKEREKAALWFDWEVGFSFTAKKSSNNLILWQVKDEVKRHDPCLVEFAKLSEEERNQNLQMAADTLR